MNRQQAPYNFFFKIFCIYGLNENFKNYKKLLLFILSAPLYIVFLIVLAIHLNDIKDVKDVVQIIPYYVAISIKVFFVTAKYKHILCFIEKLEKTIREQEQKKFSEQSYRFGIGLITFCFFFNFFPPFIVQIVSLYSRESFLPIYIPENLISYEREVFLFYWVIITFCGFYCSLLVLSIDLLMVYLLKRIEGFSSTILVKTVKFEFFKHETHNSRSIELLRKAQELKW